MSYRTKQKPIPPGYLEAVARLAGKVGPGIHHVTVEHDDDCLMINGGSECTCGPFLLHGAPEATA